MNMGNKKTTLVIFLAIILFASFFSKVTAGYITYGAIGINNGCLNGGEQQGEFNYIKGSMQNGDIYVNAQGWINYRDSEHWYNACKNFGGFVFDGGNYGCQLDIQHGCDYANVNGNAWWGRQWSGGPPYTKWLGIVKWCVCTNSGDHCTGQVYQDSCGDWVCWGSRYCCSDSSWTPDPSTVCSGTYFTQTSNCGNTRGATGTRVCCVPNCACATNIYQGQTCPDNCGGACNGQKPRPTLNFSANPVAVSKNQTSNLVWTTQNTSSCWASGDWSGWKNSTGGMESTGVLATSKNYSLECWNSANMSTGIKNVTVHVNSCVPPQSQANNSKLCVADGDLGLSVDTNIQNFDGDSNCSGKCQYKCQYLTAKVADNCPSPIDGDCGDAINNIFCQKPMINLCANGTEPTTPVSSASSGNSWEWTCKGIFGSTVDKSCHAFKSCAYREVVPN
jgi:hypothetical protein